MGLRTVVKVAYINTRGKLLKKYEPAKFLKLAMKQAHMPIQLLYWSNMGGKWRQGTKIAGARRSNVFFYQRKMEIYVTR